MRKSIALRTLPWLLFASMTAVAQAADNKVVIGDIDDMSGLYADVIGPGGIEAAKMAIEDLGGSVLGNKIELITTDHQNKPDLGAQKFREWADRDGLTMVAEGGKTWFFLTADYAFG